jgi:NAD(P)-dependent dehydrogenase (short-subunit alcohol dehydrogenase family)
MDLTNASAIVTGGTGGFGAATVRRLAQKGVKVVIADVSASEYYSNENTR